MSISGSDLCISLYITAKAFRNEHQKRLKKLGLTFTQFIVMIILWEGKPLLVKEIGKKLDLDSGTLTPVLKKLEEKGYVIRSQSEDDARDVLVTLTDEGSKLHAEVDRIHDEITRKMNMDSDKMERILGLLTELSDSLKEILRYETEQ